MSKVNTLVILKDNYKTKNEFETAIGQAVVFFMNNGYVVCSEFDRGEIDLGVAVIQFESNDPNCINLYPYWLNEDQAEALDNLIENHEMIKLNSLDD